MHFIIPHYYSGNYIRKKIQKALKKYDCTSAILSLIGMSKQNCITKERYEKMYQINKDSEERMDLSVREDLETFIGEIKNGEINEYTIPERGDHKETFLLCLLNEEERRKLERKDSDFMETFDRNLSGKADVPEAEWKASESNMKFAISKCSRHTYFIDPFY